MRKADLIDAILEQAGQGNGARAEGRDSAEVKTASREGPAGEPEAGNGSSGGGRAQGPQASADTQTRTGERGASDGEGHADTSTRTRQAPSAPGDRGGDSGECRRPRGGGARRRVSRAERRRPRQERRERHRKHRAQEPAEAH